MLDRQEEKISRSLMTICNVFCFREPDYQRKSLTCSQFVSSWTIFWEGNSQVHRVINLEMTKVLKDKRFNNVFPGQKCISCVGNV